MSADTTRLRSVSAFFPCFNEQGNVAVMVQQLTKALQKLSSKYEIIIINDGSTDQTEQEAQRCVSADPQHIRCISHTQNLGYGASLRTGFAAATMDWIFYTDGDQQFDVHQLREFVPFAKTYDVVIGYRQHRAEGFVRTLNANLFKLYIDLLFRVHVRDIDCAFKLIRRELLQHLPLESTGAFTSAEFLYRLKKRGVQFKQLPVRHYPRKLGTATGTKLRVIFKAGWEALRLYIRIKFVKKNAT